MVVEHPQRGSLGAVPRSAPAWLGRPSCREALGRVRCGAEGLYPLRLESPLSVVFPLGSLNGQELMCAHSWDEQPGILAPLGFYIPTKV